MYVITGGGSGLGCALALELTKRQQNVLVVGRNLNNLQATAKQSPHIEYFRADVSSAADRSKLVEKLLGQTNLLGLVHNAGIIDPIIPMTQMHENEWRACMATNLDAPFFLTKALFPVLGKARVLNVGSGAAYFPIKGWSAYCSSKAALAMLTRCWNLEEPDLQIASVMPGIIDTPMQGTIRDSQYMDPDKHAFFLELKNSGRLLTPQTVAAFLVWLLLDVTKAQYGSKEWDIYDTTHHDEWLREPNSVPLVD